MNCLALVVLFCGFLSHSHGQTGGQGTIESMASDPSLLLEPNPRGGLLPPAPTTPKPKKKKALLPLVNTRKKQKVRKELPKPHTDMGSSQPHMGSADPHAGHLRQDLPPTTLKPEVQPRKNNQQFSLAGSEIVKEWLPSNFNDQFPGLDAKSMLPSDSAAPSKSVNQIFSSNLGSVQVPDSGRGSQSQAMTNKGRTMVESQPPVSEIGRIDPMANAGELFLDSFSNIPEFGNAIDLKSTPDRQGQILDIATGIVQGKDTNVIPDRGPIETEYTFLHEAHCRTKAHTTPTGEIVDAKYEEFINGHWIVRWCAPGSGYNATTCGCDTMMSALDQREPGKCLPVINLTFKEKYNVAVESEGVDIHDRQAFLNGNNRLRIWTFINYEYTDKLQITFKFKPKPGPRSEPYTLVSNCESKQEPSFGIVLNTFKDVVTFFLKTYGTEGERFMTFDIDPNSWNDVYFRYDNGTMIGRVNDEVKQKSIFGKIQNRPDAIVFGKCERYGNYRGQLKDIEVYSKCVPPLERKVKQLSGVLP
ncbi:asparagine-rich protein-like isoform X2 [Ostrea edulis]|uniref:asparagine-rich protein-like isoform X2 n=1 Tax=Ostrea edulis TaxID=37623 RepID=UPI002094A765|nr:asparagine-rich protein-like isoform X2 [Ostrea edulis]